MTTKLSDPAISTARTDATPASVRRRLRPLYAATMLQGIALWVPVEKLFMTEIGFNAASIGVMAAAYAAVVPLLEVPTGILADRWSRRGVMILASLAGLLHLVIGALSHNVTTYIVASLLLGAFIAFQSGTVDALVYDVVVEVTGDSDQFQRYFGRTHLYSSAALTASALLGGWIAAVASTRATYVLTIPFLVGSVAALLRFDEPTLHRRGQHLSLRSHVTATYRAVSRRGLLPVVAMSVLCGLMLQMVFEFGPLCLVALRTSPALYGPVTAAMLLVVGLAGPLAGRLKFNGLPTLATIAAGMTVCGLTVVTIHHALVVITALAGLALFIVTVSIFMTRLLHDAIRSEIRSGVSSLVSTVTWIGFMPVALAFGLVTKAHGVYTGGRLIAGLAALAALLAVHVGVRSRSAPAVVAAAAA